MTAIGGVFRDVVDHHRFAALPDLMADGGFDLEFPAGHKAKRDLVAHRATNPAVLGDACGGGEAHASGTAYHFKNARHRCDPLHGSDIRVELGRHCQPSTVVPVQTLAHASWRVEKSLQPEPKAQAALNARV